MHRVMMVYDVWSKEWDANNKQNATVTYTNIGLKKPNKR